MFAPIVTARPHIRKPVRVFLRFAHEQGECHKLLAPEDLFPETVRSAFKV
ncbi:MAG: hypothetical protein OEN55_11970 [Alphaproteobacteria bacterium]|nr:hypothetical protein [Alphaproteobacteria bacterium]